MFIGNRIVKVMWDNAQRHDEGRFLALPVLTAKNDTAESFGQYDTLSSGPQSLYSVASMPWSWYQTAVSLDYITVKLVRGPNMRVDNLTVQIETAIGSITDLLGQDTCSTTKGRTTQHGNPLVGIYEACDNGTTFDVYANIARLGTNSFANWQGQVVAFAQSNLGTATNDLPRSQVLRNYAACVVGDAAPTHIFGHQQIVASYMFTLDSQVRVSPGDSANPYLGNPHLLGAQWVETTTSTRTRPERTWATICSTSTRTTRSTATSEKKGSTSCRGLTRPTSWKRRAGTSSAWPAPRTTRVSTGLSVPQTTS